MKILEENFLEVSEVLINFIELKLKAIENFE